MSRETKKCTVASHFQKVDGEGYVCQIEKNGGVCRAKLKSKFGKDSPLEGDESSIICVTGGRPGPSSHCSLSNHQFKIKQ